MARPRTYKTQGVVLKQSPLGEADRILTLYTADRGKIRAVARGVRRTKSKVAGHLEPLTHAMVSVAEGRSLDAITEAETVTSFRAVKEDLKRISLGMYLAELVDAFSADGSPNPRVFELLLSALGWIQQTDDPAKALRHFEVQLLWHSGFGPELHRCVECSSVVGPGDHLYSCSKGGILCEQCRKQPDDRLVALTVNASKVLRYLQRERYERVAELKVPTPILAELERLLRAYLRYVLDRELKSVEFMHLVASDREVQAVR